MVPILGKFVVGIPSVILAVPPDTVMVGAADLMEETSEDTAEVRPAGGGTGAT